MNPMLRLAFRAYKTVVSPILHAISPTQCKFLPTCSEYAYIALARHGFFRGTGLALRRIAHCHPWSRGGLDPVPPVTEANAEKDKPFIIEDGPIARTSIPDPQQYDR